MLDRQPSSNRNSSEEPFLTIRIRLQTAIVLAVSLVVLVGLILFLRDRHPQPVDRASFSIITPVQPPQASPTRKQAQRAESAPSEPYNSSPHPTQKEHGSVLQRSEYNNSQSQAVYTGVFVPVIRPQPQTLSQPVVASVVAVKAAPARPPSVVTSLPRVKGAGATSLRPIYEKWFDLYERRNPGAEFQYEPDGNRAGIRELVSGEVDFTATDVPLTDEQLNQIPIRIVHVPSVLGAVVPVYNVPGVQGEIRFTADILAGIFLGRITFWDDPDLVNANPAQHLPRLPIVVVYRSDDGTTNTLFTDYLSKASPLWANEVARGPSIQWPVGTGAKGNQGVAASISQTEGAIGYVDYLYSQFNPLCFGSVQNQDGQFVKASPETMTAAASAVKFPPDFRASLINAPGPNSYPITGLSWLLLPQSGSGHLNRASLLRFLLWSLTEGEKTAVALHYGPLPEQVSRQALQVVTGLASH